MYLIAGRIYLRLLPTIFIFALLLTALERAISYSPYASAITADLFNIGALVLIAFATHQKVLIGKRTSIWLIPAGGSETNAQLGSFFGRFVLLFLPLVAMFALVLALIIIFASHIGATAAFRVPLFMTILLSPFWVAAAGTMLPAAAVGGDTSFNAAFGRARKTYWATVGRLFVGPVLFAIPAAIIVTLFVFSAIYAFSISEDDVANLPAWSIFLEDVLLTSIMFFAPILTATALSMAYQRAEAAQTPPPLPNG